MIHKRSVFLMAALIAALLLSGTCLAKDVFVPGTRTASTYVNESIGIGIDLPENYVMATDEEMAQMMQIGVETLLDENKAEEFLNYSDIALFYDMAATNVINGSSISIIAEKPALSGITLDQYTTASVSQLEEYLGITEVHRESSEMCGRTWNAIVYPMEVSGISLMNYTLVTKTEDRFASITIGITDSNETDIIFDSIYCTD